MTLSSEELPPDDDLSQLWREDLESGAADTYAYAAELAEAYDSLCPQGVAFEPWIPDLDPVSWTAANQQTIGGVSMLDSLAATRRQLTQADATFSSTTTSNISTPCLQGDFPNYLNFPNPKVEPDTEDILRRRSFDSLRAVHQSNVNEETLVSRFCTLIHDRSLSSCRTRTDQKALQMQR